MVEKARVFARHAVEDVARVSLRRAVPRPTLSPPKKGRAHAGGSAYSRGLREHGPGGMGGLAKRRCGIRLPAAAIAARAAPLCGKKAGLVPPKRVFPLPDFHFGGGMPGRGVQGGNPAGGNNLAGAARRAPCDQRARVFARTPPGVSIAVTVMLMIKSRNWLPGRCGSRLLAAGAA